MKSTQMHQTLESILMNAIILMKSLIENKLHQNPSNSIFPSFFIFSVLMEILIQLKYVKIVIKISILRRPLLSVSFYNAREVSQKNGLFSKRLTSKFRCKMYLNLDVAVLRNTLFSVKLLNCIKYVALVIFNTVFVVISMLLIFECI